MLLECLVAIMLTGLLLFATISAYYEFTHKNQLSILVNDLTNTLEYARNSAITLHTNIIFCANNGEGACGSNWQNGQLILNENDQKVLRELPLMPSGYHLFWRSTLGDSVALRWRSDGFTRGQQGSFFICGRKDHFASSAQIIILRTGRLRVETGVIAGCDDLMN